jgi:Dyp-type peroxidase family
VNAFRRHRVDRRDLQGNILAAYGNCYPHALYAFLRISDAQSARNWLGQLVPRVTTAVHWDKHEAPRFTINVALSFSGLTALGVPKPLRDTFPEVFQKGMACRAKELGDVGRSAPAKWDEELVVPRPGAPPSEHDLLVTLYGQDQDAIAEALSRSVVPGQSSGAVVVAYQQEAALLGNPNTYGPGREHFGFADGFGQPNIRGNAGPWDRPGNGTARKRGCWKAVAPGEFVLGYRGEDGAVARKPAAPLRQSGTYTVVRKLQQNVAEFTNYLRAHSGGNPAREEWLAARIVGRWRDGTPVMVSPDRNDAALAADYGPGGRINDFRYKDDIEGLRCPLGAHIRRANPRDSFGWKSWFFRPDARLTKRHRIIRRGMPYGPMAKDPAKPDGKSRGLMFVCHQASIERQFEMIQGQWLNDGDAFWLGTQRDLLTAGRDPHHPPRTGMMVQGRPPIFLSEPPVLIETRGGGYFFTPGIDALRTIAAGDWV